MVTVHALWASGPLAIMARFEVVPCDEQESADQSEMLEERVLHHEAIGRRQFPKSIGKEGRNQREARQPQRAKPAVEAAEDQSRSGELRDDRGHGKWHGGAQSEMLHLGD